MNQDVYHIPALLEETLEGLNIIPSGVYVDVTFGGGGHSRAILAKLGSNGRLYSFDQDEDAIKNRLNDSRFTFVYSNFRFLSNFMKYHDVDGVDGILGDLGVSFHHFDDSERGFSFRWNGDLDMRMNRKSSRTASWILNNYSVEKLADMFFINGELKSARRMASLIDSARQKTPILKVEQLLSIVRSVINPKQEKKELAQVFQALRIEVNGELDALKAFLTQSLKELKVGGRLAIITYHSLEDRIVKNFLKSGNFTGEINKDFYGRSMTPFKLVNNKPIVPTYEEIERNPRARSAKLRVAQKL